MARVFQYVRPVNAVLTSVDLENKANCSENEIRIKEEPPDLQYDDPESLLNDVDASVENESVSRKHHHSSVANNENNQYMLRSKFADSNRDSLSSAEGRSKRLLGVASESRDSQQSKRRRTISGGHSSSSSQTDNVGRSAENKVVCNVCFTAFRSVQILKLHLRRYVRSLTCMTCDICNDVFSSTKSFHRHKQKHYQNSAPDHRIRSRCCFCQRKFSSLKYLQMHLFHYHPSLMQLQNVKVDEIESSVRAAMFETKLASKDVGEHESITQTEETDNRVIQDPNVTQESVSTNESVSEKDPECTLVADVIDETERDTSAMNVEQSAASTDISTKSDGSRSVKKRMRQTTLTEFLSFSGKSLKKDIIKSEKVNTTEDSSDTDGQDTKNWTPGCASTPVHTPRSNTSVKDIPVNTATGNTQFLTMHMNPESIITLLNNQIKTEPIDHDNTAESQKSPHNPKTTKHACPELRDAIPSNVSATDKRTLRARLSQEERLKIKYKCRECVVRLVRCDYTSNRVLLKIDESNGMIPLQLKVGRPERKSIDSKETISKNPQIRIMKLENCIVVEVLGSR